MADDILDAFKKVQKKWDEAAEKMLLERLKSVGYVTDYRVNGVTTYGRVWVQKKDNQDIFWEHQGLEDFLREASDVYYKTGDELIPDQEFDVLKDLLQYWSPGARFLVEVGATEDPNSGFPKARHTIQMGSLEKAMNMQEMQEWYEDRVRVLNVH